MSAQYKLKDVARTLRMLAKLAEQGKQEAAKLPGKEVGELRMLFLEIEDYIDDALDTLEGDY